MGARHQAAVLQPLQQRRQVRARVLDRVLRIPRAQVEMGVDVWLHLARRA